MLFLADDTAAATAGVPSEPARRALALREHLLAFQAAISAPERCSVPIIAAIHGIAYGLALDMITACDVRYAAHDARFSIKVRFSVRPCPVLAHTPLIRLLLYLRTHTHVHAIHMHAHVLLMDATEQEVDVGLAPDMGTLARLRHTTSNASLASELIYTAREFSADEALRLGLVSRVVMGGRDAVVGAALDLARDIVQKSPLAVAGAKHLLGHARDHR